MSFLTQILADKRVRVDALKATVSPEAMRERAEHVRSSSARHRLRSALQREGVNVIAEFKRKSPSKGIIREDVDVKTMVQSYAAGGAVAISVLTEEDYFDGSLEDLRAVKSSVDLPVLRKDFIFEEYQLFEAAAAGADAILLIVAALDDATLVRLRQTTEDELGMDALVEVHDADEMDRAGKSGAKLIGVNNRNLHTFEVTLKTSLDLAGNVPAEFSLVSESGLRTAGDLTMLKKAGYRGFLIGESLMRSEKPEELLQQLIGK